MGNHPGLPGPNCPRWRKKVSDALSVRSYQELPKGRSIFIIPGAAKRHKGLTPNCPR